MCQKLDIFSNYWFRPCGQVDLRLDTILLIFMTDLTAIPLIMVYGDL